MTYAAITGWGKCMPPAVLDNAGLATFIDTTDEWIPVAHRHQGTTHFACADDDVVARRGCACARVRRP